jgi:hypothetical protein
MPHAWEIEQRTYRGCEGFVWSAIDNCVHNCQLMNKEALANFNGFSQDGGREKVS